MKDRMYQYLILVLTFMLVLQTTGCGTILYPERRNQEAGRIDVGVALLDGFWLLVGVVPGIIAFAVDFSTGAIYIPQHDLVEGKSSDYRVVQFDPETMTKRDIEVLISQEIGNEFSFSDKHYHMSRLNDKDEWESYIKKIL